MSTKTISITEDAYERLKGLKDSERRSFSEVILKYYPEKKKLSKILAEIASFHATQDARDLADEVEKGSEELRAAKMRAAGDL